MSGISRELKRPSVRPRAGASTPQPAEQLPPTGRALACRRNHENPMSAQIQVAADHYEPGGTGPFDSISSLRITLPSGHYGLAPPPAMPKDEARALIDLLSAAPGLLAALRPFIEPFDLFSDDDLRRASDPSVKVRGISTREARLVWAGRQAIAEAEGWNSYRLKTINKDVDVPSR